MANFLLEFAGQFNHSLLGFFLELGDPLQQPCEIDLFDHIVILFNLAIHSPHTLPQFLQLLPQLSDISIRLVYHLLLLLQFDLLFLLVLAEIDTQYIPIKLLPQLPQPRHLLSYFPVRDIPLLNLHKLAQFAQSPDSFIEIVHIFGFLLNGIHFLLPNTSLTMKSSPTLLLSSCIFSLLA